MMKNFFLSLKTTVWLLFGLVCLFFVGSCLMPMHREVFGPMNEDILLRWTLETALQNVSASWWFFTAVLGLALLTINTLVCSWQSIAGKWTRSDALLRLAPQIIHLGFLFILAGHLASAGWGYKLSGMLPEGASVALPDNLGMRLERIHVDADPSGYMTNWSADVKLFEGTRSAASGSLGPNRPLFHAGVGVYVKTLNFDQRPAAFMMVVKDPGTIWAFIGGMMFLVGTILLLVLKWKKA